MNHATIRNYICVYIYCIYIINVIYFQVYIRLYIYTHTPILHCTFIVAILKPYQTHITVICTISMEPRKPLAVYVFAPSPVVDHVMASTSSGAVVVGDVMMHKGNPELPFGGRVRDFVSDGIPTRGGLIQGEIQQTLI